MEIAVQSKHGRRGASNFGGAVKFLPEFSTAL